MAGPILYKKGLLGDDSLLTNLLNYWDLDSGDATMVDKRGSDNLTEGGNVLTNATGAPDGGACSNFGNAAGYYFRTSFARKAAYDKSFAVNIWVYSTATSNTGNWVINHRGTDSADVYWQLMARRNLVPVDDRFQIYLTDSTQTIITDDAESLNVWQMLTAVKTPTSVSLYRNGSLVASDSYNNGIENNTTTTQPFAIGAASWALSNTGFRHRGLLFAAGIWAEALDQDKITALYNSGKGIRYNALT
jgi:hypothetical protein